MNYTHTFHEPVYMVEKHNKFVLISEKDYRSMMETLYISTIPGMKESLLNLSKEPLETFSDTLDWDNV